MAGGYIKLHRQILDWEWYGDANTFRLFVHLLLKANYKELSFEGRTILRGQLVTSLPKLSSQTRLSVRQVRVSLEHLKMTGELTVQTFNRYRIITIVNYDEYQDDDRQNDRQMTGEMTGKGQTDDRQMTGKRQADDRQMTASKEYKEIKKEKKGIMEKERDGRTAQRFSPPSRDEIEIFCLENGLTIDVDRFLDYYTSNGWMVGKSHMKDWQATVRNWSRRDQQQVQQKPEPARRFDRPAKQVVAQQYKQRAYDDVQAELIAEQNREMEEWLRNGGGA